MMYMGGSFIQDYKFSLPSELDEWTRIQDSLKKRVVMEDDFAWTIDVKESNTSICHQNKLRYIGGVDLSFSKEDPSIACAALVVVDFNTMNVIYEDFNVSRLQTPYVPGFLAFREGPIILELLEKMRNEKSPFYPQFFKVHDSTKHLKLIALVGTLQLLMVDGNGLLHPRGFGLACHLGVVTDLPSIGIGKNLHHVDGLTESGVRQLLKSQSNSNGEIVMLTGDSGLIWGAAMRSTVSSLKPIYISIGHRISLETAIQIVKKCCLYRVPEPTRQVPPNVSFVSYSK